MASICQSLAPSNATPHVPNATASSSLPLHTSIVSSLLLLTAIFGLPLNALALRSVAPAGRPTTHYAVYVSCLVTSDALFLALQAIHTVCRLAGVSGAHPGLVLFRSLIAACNASSAFVLAWIGLQRALAVAYPIWWRLGRSRSSAFTACLALWALGLAMGALYGLARSPRNQAAQRPAIWAEFGLAFAAPFLTFVAASLYVGCRGPMASGSTKKASRLLAAILVNAAVFLLCWVPYNTFVFAYYQAQWAGRVRVCVCAYLAAYYSVCLLNVKSCLVPLVYILPSRDFGLRFRRSMPAFVERRFSEESGLASPVDAHSEPGPRTGSCR